MNPTIRRIVLGIVLMGVIILCVWIATIGLAEANISSAFNKVINTVIYLGGAAALIIAALWMFGVSFSSKD